MNTQAALGAVEQPGKPVAGVGPGQTADVSLSHVPTQPTLQEFLRTESLTKIIQATGIKEQLLTQHDVSGNYKDPNRTSSHSYSFNYSIKSIGEGSCLAAEHQPRLRVNQQGQVEGLLALEVNMKIRATDFSDSSDITVKDTLWVPIKNGQPVRNFDGFVSPCEDGKHYLVQNSEKSPGAELLIRAVERSEFGRYRVFDDRLSEKSRANPARWDEDRRKAVVYSPGHVAVQGSHSGPLQLDLRWGDTFDGRQITYDSTSQFHPANCTNHPDVAPRGEEAVIPVLRGEPLTSAFGCTVISSRGPWHYSPEGKFSGLLELTNKERGTRLALVYGNKTVESWNDFTVKPLEGIEVPGAKVAALVSLRPTSASKEQQQPASLSFWGTNPVKPEPPKDRIVPYVDGKMITTIEIDKNGQTAEIIEAKTRSRDGGPLPLEIKDGKVWTGTVIAKVPFSDKIYSVTIQDGRIAATLP
jgi:hypothetical protein